MAKKIIITLLKDFVYSVIGAIIAFFILKWIRGA